MERRAARGAWTAAALCAAATSMAAATAPEVRAGTPHADAPADPPLTAADRGLEPFSAQYVAEWRDITVGTSDLELERGARPGRYHYRWTISARGIFRIVYSHDVTQQSWFTVVDDHVRPNRYRGEEGSEFVAFDFDWDTGHAFGSSEGRPIDILLKPGAQDLMSIQVEIMLDLLHGVLPANFPIIDKDKLKDFLYAREGSAKLRTAIGTLDTVIVASRRTPNDADTQAAALNQAPAARRIEAAASRHGRDASLQVFGSVTPRWPWYLPPRSLYEVSQTSSDSRNSICATPSFA